MMYFLVDITNNRAIARHTSYRALAALHFIQFANVDATIVPLGENKGFCAFDEAQLQSIGASLGIQLAGPYNEKIKQLRAAAESTSWLELPYTEHALEVQALKILPTEDRPFAFVPTQDTPELLRAWHFEPQRNRRRLDSSYAPGFTSGGIDGKGTPSAPLPPGSRPASPGSRPASPPPAAHRAPTAPARPGSATPAAPKAPRAPRAASSGPSEAHRPKPGTSTGRVWDLADLLSARLEGKELRKALIAACEEENINASTASVQFGKWKSAKGL